MPSAMVCTRTSRPLFVSWYSRDSRSPTVAICACASSSVRPGASRPMRVRYWDRRFAAVSAVNDSGAQSCVPIGKSKPGGAMPTTSCGVPSTSIERPTIDASDAKRRCHKPCPSTTRRCCPRVSSSGRKLRPAIGWTPSTGKKSADTKKPCTFSGSSRPTRLAFQNCHAASRSKASGCCRFMSRKSAGETDS